MSPTQGPDTSSPADLGGLGDAALAARLATEAGARLLGVRERIARGECTAAEAKDAGDREAHDFLVAALAEARPADAVLSEEGTDDPTRLSAERVWIVDPLDGTREFGEPPRTDWAVHVALVVDHEVVASAVALPGAGLTLSTDPAPPPPPPMPERPRVVVSRTRPPALAQAVALIIGGDLVGMGSAGAKATAVVRGEADVYVHGGGQYEWDSAAPAGVALAAGCHASRLDGSPLRYNQPNPWLPDLVVCRAELAATVLDAIATASREIEEQGGA